MNLLQGLCDREWDLLIVGGGINGCAIARDAALRGWKTALVERNDFASETSSRTTKLVHGGIRYLEHFDFRLVQECLHERTILLTIAPHLVRPLPFFFPIFRGNRYPFPVIQFGTWLYGRLAGKDKLAMHESYSAEEAKKSHPFLRDADLLGAVKYFDAQMDDIRLCLETALSARHEGASLANHVEVTSIQMHKNGKFDISLSDQITGEYGKTRAHCVVNAAGPFVDRVLSEFFNIREKMIQPSKGVHLVIKQKLSQDAILLSSSDKRVIFIIPWRGGSLIGTTDSPYDGSPDEAFATQDEIRFLLKEVAQITGGFMIRPKDIVTTFAGIRPLAKSSSNTAQASRNHVIRELPRHFFSIAGGKYTTHRLLAEEVCDRVEKSLRKPHVPCRTKELPLIGSFDIAGNHEKNLRIRDISTLNRGMLEHLIQTYGRNMKYVLGIAARSKQFEQLLCPHHPNIAAQVIFAMEYEMAQTLMDVCVRRLRLDQANCRGLDCAGKAANFMQERLGWSEERRQAELQVYSNWVKNNTNCLDPL